MPPAIDVFHGNQTFNNNVMAAYAPNTGDSFTVKNAPLGQDILLLQTWARLKAAGIHRIRSARLHDNVQGLRFRVPIDLAYPLLAFKYPQVLIPQDVLTVENQTADAAGNVETFAAMLFYKDLPGEAPRYIDTATLKSRLANIVTQEVAIPAVATGQYSATVALNATFDLLKANTDYAVLGGFPDVRCTSITFKGPDTGNLRQPIPGEITYRDWLKDWFWLLSDYYQLPLIPLISSANKAATLLEVVQDQAATTVNATLNLAELKPA